MDKYYIKIRSKHSGEEITLGSQYDTEKEAEKAAERDICLRCNSYSIYPIGSEMIWANKRDGFVPKENYRSERSSSLSPKAIDRIKEKSTERRKIQ